MAAKKPRKKGPTATFNVPRQLLNPISVSAAGSQAQPTTGGNALAGASPTPVATKKPPRRRSPARTGGSSSPAVQAPLGAPTAPLPGADMAMQLAMAQLQPQINSLTQEGTQAQGAHDTRAQQLTDWAGWQQGNLNSAFDDTRNALNQLVTLQGGTDQASQNTLAAALRSGTGSTDQAAQMLGAQAPQNLNPGVLASSADSAKSMELGVGSGAGALLGLVGAQRANAGVLGQQGYEQERQRYNAQTKDLATKKSDLMATLPGLVQTNLRDQQAYELEKAKFGETSANNKFQQYLAEQELGLKKKDQTFQQWLATSQVTGVDPKTGLPTEQARSNKAQEGLTAAGQASQAAIDWANVGINRTQAEGALAQIKADASKEKDAKKKEALTQRGDGMAKALEWLGGYMGQKKDEASPSKGGYPYGPGKAQVPDNLDTTGIDESKTPATSTYQRLFDDALRGMLNYTTRSDALRILMKSEYPDWRNKAKKEYNRLKRRTKPAPSAKGEGGRALQTFAK